MHQMQLTYVPEEDRMLFRLNTQGGEEFRFWMTRRYLGLLFQTLAKLVRDLEQTKSEAHAGMAVEPLAVESRHREQVGKADFETAYEESAQLPLGAEPVLLHRAAVRPGTMGQALLGMHPRQGQGIEITLNEKILHSLCKLLADTSKQAGWRLDLELVNPGPGANEQASWN